MQSVSRRGPIISRRRGGEWFEDFCLRVRRVGTLEELADKLGLTLEETEARVRVAADRGLLLAYESVEGRIVEWGLPRRRSARRHR
jgi:hypothetical protein